MYGLHIFYAKSIEKMTLIALFNIARFYCTNNKYHVLLNRGWGQQSFFLKERYGEFWSNQLFR